MTTAEKKHYNNGFILGMASKGVVKITEGLKPIRARVIDKIGLVSYTEVV